MFKHEMAYTMAYIMSPRREYRSGSIYQRSSDGRWFGAYEAGFTANGDRKRSTVSAKTRAEVVRKLRDKRLEIERDGRANVQRTITVAKWAERWLADIQPKVRPSSYETDVAAMKWVTKTIGAVKLADVRPSEVRAVAKAIRKEGGSSSTALRYHGSLLRMLKAASLDGYNIAPNVLLAENPKRAVSDRQAMTTEQIAKVVPIIAKRSDGSRWLLALVQGLRQAEALGLTWENIDLDAGTLTVCWQVKSLRFIDSKDRDKGFRIPDGYEVRQLTGATHLVRPKSAKGYRVIPLVPWAANVLREWHEVAPENAHGLVWPGRTTKAGTWPRNPASDRDEWDEIQDAAKIKHPSGRHYHVHEIRHSTATLLMALGVPESVRIAIMGHSSIAVTRGYEHVELDLARDALAKVAHRLELE
jgi:integrase